MTDDDRTQSAPRSDLPTIDGYEVIRELGEGGMASVYLAREVSLDRLVAIKIIHSELNSPDFLARFDREAKLAAQFRHPNIIRVFANGHIDELRFIAFEFASGGTLEERLEDGPLSDHEAATIAKKVAGGLAYLHARDVIHRDVKPANILFNDEGEPVITDFGVSKDIERGSDLTQTGLSIGSPRYMSPEQLSGEPPTPKTDIYSFGLLYLKMLTGDFSSKFLNRPNEWEIGAHRDIIRKCLAVDAEERPSAEECVAAIDELINRPRGNLKRKRYAQIVAVVAISLLAITWFVYRPGSGQNPENELTKPSLEIKRVAVLPFANMMNDPDQDYFVDGISHALVAELAQIENIRVVSRTSVSRYKNTDKTVPEIAAELSTDALVEGSVLRSQDEIHISAQLIDARLDEYLWARNFSGGFSEVFDLQTQVVLGIAEGIDAVLTPAEKTAHENRRSIDALAYEDFLRGRHFWERRTGPDLERALTYFDRALDLEPDYGVVHSAVADAYGLLAIYEYREPVMAYHASERYALRAIELNPGDGDPYASLGQVYDARDHNWLKAEQTYRSGIELSPRIAQNYLFYAAHLLAIGRMDAAAAAIQSAEELDPLSPLAGTFQVRLYDYLGDSEKAIAVGTAALDLQPDFPATMWRLGEAYYAHGNYEMAISYFEKLTDMTRRHPMFVSYLGMALGASGQRDRALELVRELEEAIPWPRVRAGNLARIYLGLGEHDNAVDALRQALGSGQMLFLDLNASPTWNALRDHPGFNAILASIGFPARDDPAFGKPL